MAINWEQYQPYFADVEKNQPNRKSELDALKAWSPESAGAGNITDAANLIPGLRDELASERDAYWQPRMQAFRESEAAAGRTVDMGDAGLIAGGFGKGGAGSTQPGQSTAGWLPGVGSTMSGGAAQQYQQDPAVAQAMQMQTQLMQRMFEQQQAGQAANRQRGDTLYAQLMQRANQGLEVSPNNPVIKAQTDAFAAQQERAKRNYISDTAEREGPYANLRGERRMASERAGQATGSLQAQLMGREVDAKRQEIQAALSGAAGLLTAEQEASLRQQLGMLGGLADQQRIGIAGQGQDTDRLRAMLQDRQYYAGLGSIEDQFGANFGLDAWQRARELERLRELPIGSVNYGF